MFYFIIRLSLGSGLYKSEFTTCPTYLEKFHFPIIRQIRARHEVFLHEWLLVASDSLLFQ